MVSYNSLKSIAKTIAIYGGISTFIVINSIPFLLDSKIKKSDHYKQAVQLLHNHPEAIKYLGEPIKEYRIKTSEKKDYGTDGKKVWISVPVKGSKDSGKLYYDFPVTVNNETELSQVELTVKSLEGYKLLIKRKY